MFISHHSVSFFKRTVHTPTVYALSTIAHSSKLHAKRGSSIGVDSVPASFLFPSRNIFPELAQKYIPNEEIENTSLENLNIEDFEFEEKCDYWNLKDFQQIVNLRLIFAKIGKLKRKLVYRRTKNDLDEIIRLAETTKILREQSMKYWERNKVLASLDIRNKDYRITSSQIDHTPADMEEFRIQIKELPFYFIVTKIYCNK
ncbi:hypothetical protein CsSME_00043524 [Camellia sinensis var. sinensis]